MNKPLICTLNLSQEINKRLKQNGFNITPGSIGTQIRTENKLDYESKLCLSNSDLPENIHEYDIFILDLTENEVIPYRQEQHIRVFNKTGANTFFISRHPQNIFDPRAYGIGELKEMLDFNRESIFIVFCGSCYQTRYDYVEVTGSRYSDLAPDIVLNYGFLTEILPPNNKFGFEVEIVKNNLDEMEVFLQKYVKDLRYHVTFIRPTVFHQDSWVEDPLFTPLITNAAGEVISFNFQSGHFSYFFFPDIDNKGDFLLNFLQEVAPGHFPQFFPESEKNKWTNESRYYLPNHLKLLNEKKTLELEYEKKVKTKELELQVNAKQYLFLHDLLTKTDTELVNSVIVFLKWLGFPSVRDMDQQGSSKDEDLQVETDKGLLIVEVKGLGGTSKDSECSQINKHKHRRSKERNKFDVFALYLVNHQRHLPPHLRQNPPFTAHQINDAIHDERGLVTTWDLFNLYFNIEKGIVTKEEAMESFFDFGLVDFYKSLESLGKPKEVLKKGEIAIFDIRGNGINVNQIIYIKEDDNFDPAKIISIQVNDTNVHSALNCEVGVKASKMFSKKSEIFTRTSL